MSGLPASAHDRFARFVGKMLLTFFTVVAVDLVAVSLLTGDLRVWFPVWLDAGWETRPDPWVVYSQSYFAGIFFIPLLAYAVDRDLLRARIGGGVRAACWLGLLGAFGFILVWKGELMLRYDKHWETLGWLALMTFVWVAISAAALLPRWLEAMTPRHMARVLARGVAVFFLVMAVLDPLLQLGVQRVAPSSGLYVEVGFFVPAGLVLLWVARRLREPEDRERVPVSRSPAPRPAR
jgi:hypothetical protein